MGKCLVIKNADFSSVAIEKVTPEPEISTIWYSTKAIDQMCNRNMRNYENTSSLPTFYSVEFDYLYNVPINIIRSKFVNSGEDVEHTVSTDIEYGIYIGKPGGTPTLIKSFYLNESQIEDRYIEINLDTTIFLETYEMITIGGYLVSQTQGGTIGLPLGRLDSDIYKTYYQYKHNEGIIKSVQIDKGLDFTMDCGYKN